MTTTHTPPALYVASPARWRTLSYWVDKALWVNPSGWVYFMAYGPYPDTREVTEYERTETRKHALMRDQPCTL